MDTTNDQFIQFDASSAHKDVSQTTVPFIDAQPVAPTPATWLGGAGLYHKVEIRMKKCDFYNDLKIFYRVVSDMAVL